MAWAFTPSMLAGISDIPTLVRKLVTHLSRLAQQVVSYEQVAILAYGATVRSSGEYSRTGEITVTNATPWTLANPSKPREGVTLAYDLFNNTAGAMGAVTFGTEFQLAGAFVAPGAGKRRLYSFYRTRQNTWRETGRSPADI